MCILKGLSIFNKADNRNSACYRQVVWQLNKNMSTEIYGIKNKSEPLIFFKWLKLFAIWLGSWWGIWGILFIILYVPTHRTAFSGLDKENNRIWLLDNWDTITTLIPWLAVAIVVYYVVSTAWYDRIDRFEFDDEKEELRIFCYGYFTHFPGNVFIPYKSLSAELLSDRNFLYGDYLILKIMRNSHVEARITKTSRDWQRLPNTINRVFERIKSIMQHN